MPTAPAENSEPHLLLLAAPWHLFTRPSIQVSVLKAFVRQQMPDIKVSAHHLFLQFARHIGYDLYHAISQRTWLAESVFAALLFPEKETAAQQLFFREAKGNPTLGKVNFKDLVKEAGELSDAFIASLPDAKMLLAGVSISFCQLTAGLYLAGQLKKRFPQLPVVAGGASVAGKAGDDILRVFPQIDLVVQGEGELPLLNLLQELQKGMGVEEMPPIAGVKVKKRCSREKRIPVGQIERLDHLPVPDYDDYFDLLKGFPEKQRFFPALPVEASRGCFWQSRPNKDGGSGCAFCNLNMQWQGYRCKSAAVIERQIVHLVKRYRVLNLLFTDNVLPPHLYGTLFTRLFDLNMDLKVFAEIRARIPSSHLKQMRRAGVRELQIGIEALSTGLLKRMNKGTRAIDNIQVMKDCERYGIVNTSNLLIQFPGSTDKEVQDTLRALDFVLPFRPLRPVRFWLGLESPVWHHSKAFGLKAIYTHPYYRNLFPESVRKELTLTIQGYRGDMAHQRRLWQPVVRKVKKWRQDYFQMVRFARGDPPLYFQDGESFIIIVQRRPAAEPLKHRLSGHSRSIYLFCETHRSFKRILLQFSFLSAENIRSFLKMMVTKRLMYEEDDRYLSLAVPLNR